MGPPAPAIYGISGWDTSTALATASGAGVDGSAAGVSLVMAFYLNSLPSGTSQQLIRRLASSAGYDLSVTTGSALRAQFGNGTALVAAPTRTFVAGDVGKIHLVGMSADIAATSAYLYFDRGQVGASTAIAAFVPFSSTMAMGSSISGVTPATSCTILGMAGRDTPLSLADFQAICDASRAAGRLDLGGVPMLHMYSSPQGGAMPATLPDTIGGEHMTFALGSPANLDVVQVPNVWGWVPPEALEVPETIPGLKAWFDSRNPAHFALGAGGEVSAWLSRAGSLAGITWLQGTASNQPIRVASDPQFNNLPAVLLDGVNDSIATNDQAAWTFMHDGTGHSVFRVFRVDSTGPSAQRPLNNATNAVQIGFLQQFSTTIFSFQIVNGSGTSVALWNVNTPQHYARDVSRWQMLGHVTGTSHSRVSGSSLTFADVGGPPSGAASTYPLRMGASPTVTQPFKGQIVQELYYDHVLTAGETTQLANWAASIYGVAP